MRWLLIVVLVSQASFADELSEWVNAKIALQRKGLDGAQGVPVWREDIATIPQFVPPTSLAPLVKAVRSGVVNISTRNEGTARSLGSGFVISSNGLVVTNSHVVAKAREISVRSSAGTQFTATLVGRDDSTDLALLKMTPDATVVPVTLGDSDVLNVGDWVVAIGNPFGLEMSVTNGIISARERDIGVGAYDDFIQTNALINPGNSGGPLFDMKGRVIGVTTAVSTHGQGIGFALPINLVKELIPNLLDDGRVERGWLGVSVREVDGPNDAENATVDNVYPDGPAAKAGLLEGDIIETVDGRKVERYQQLLRRIGLQPPGTKVKLGIRTQKKTRVVEIELAARPASSSVQTLANSGRIDSIGLVLKESDAGLKIVAVTPGGTAESSGLQVGDQVTEINRSPVKSFRDVAMALTDPSSSDVMLIKFTRGATTRYVAVHVQ